MRNAAKLIWIAVLLTIPSAQAHELPVFGSPSGLASGEISVGRNSNWFSIAEKGESVTSVDNGPAVRFGPAGSLPLPLPSGATMAAVGLLPDGSVRGRISGMLNGSPIGTRLGIWTSGAGGPTLAETLGESSNGSTLNNAISHNMHGEVVGYALRYVNGSAVGNFRPVKWSETGAITELGIIATDGSQPDTRATRISTSGHVIGFGRASAASDFRPIRWLPGSTMAMELETFAPLTASQAQRGDVNGVNDQGTAAGSSRYFANTSTTFGFNRAVRWENSGASMTVLDGLSSTRASVAYGVNAQGDAVGEALPDTGPSRAVLWSSGQSQPTVLEALPGVPANASGDRAYAINRVRSVVGFVGLWNGASFVGNRAALWANGSTDLLDLNTLLPPDSGWTLNEAGAITETGFIRGTGRFDPDGAGGAASYNRSWSMLVPEAGTYGRGDANFDTHINFDDLLILAQHYGQSNASQDIHVGDLNLDGNVNFDDLLTLAQHYGSNSLVNLSGLGESFAADWSLAVSMVPEPAMLLPLVCFPCQRRRR